MVDSVAAPDERPIVRPDLQRSLRPHGQTCPGVNGQLHARHAALRHVARSKRVDEAQPAVCEGKLSDNLLRPSFLSERPRHSRADQHLAARTGPSEPYRIGNVTCTGSNT